MEMAYYSGTKEKDRFKRCIDVLIETKTKIKKYDNLNDTIYISYNGSAITAEGVLKVEKAFKKAGYLDIKVKYVGGGVSWSQTDAAANYYRDQYNKVLKAGYLEPLVITFLDQYLECFMEEKKEKGNDYKVIVIEKPDGISIVDQVRENLNEACANFKISGWVNKENLYCLIIAILYAAKVIDDHVIRRFIFATKSREIVDNISIWISSGVSNELVEGFISKLSQDELDKMCNVINWEIEYIEKHMSDGSKIKKMAGVIMHRFGV